MFSLVNSLILRALPVRDPVQLVTLTDSAARPRSDWTYPIWAEIRQRPELFDGAFAYSASRFNLTQGGETEFASGLWVSGRFFETLGVTAMLGRTLTDADDRRGTPDGPVAVISYSFWQTRFGGAADAVGRTLTIDRVPFTIVGVSPPAFFGPDVGRSYDIAIPLGAEPLVRGAETFLDARSTWWLTVMARLKRGQSPESAAAGLRAVQEQIRS